ncbi:MFS transporter [Selenomonas ruminantium]|uniref:Predicted arabinose efflux permease, MFS family n=1 Tax=Selenomonas ruminantium TaxID=971 RepID=A0A1H3VL04_SELRU|nr:MFS transporter [Selenomonas ruminantium]SDZ75455.1 Predicted arabinose efflux permease, MFS family [Selenomonas ruminantium]
MAATIPLWKKNLYICCIASFIVSIGMSQMAPILPLYIAELGVDNPADVARWSGIVFGCNFISLAIFSPIWGRLSDRWGRKPMILRASGWLGLIMIGMGFAQSVWHLVALRLLQGCLSGFQAAVIPLLAQETPKDRSGWAMGMFFTAQVSGGLMGPIFGGWLSEIIGFRNSFLLIGSCCLLGFLALTQLSETRQPAGEKTVAGELPSFRELPQYNIILGVFLTTVLLHFSLSCAAPILTVYVQEIAGNVEHLAIISGAIFSATGLASMIFASKLGRLADRIGSARILFSCLLLSGLVSIPQGMVTAPWQLGVLRFFHGIAIAGLMPSTNNLIRQLTPPALMGRIFGINQSAQFIGMFTGGFLGGQLAASIGIRNLFLLVAALLLCNALWCRFFICSRQK